MKSSQNVKRTCGLLWQRVPFWLLSQFISNYHIMQFGILYDSLFTYHKYFQFLKYLNLNFISFFQLSAISSYFCLINKIKTKAKRKLLLSCWWWQKVANTLNVNVQFRILWNITVKIWSGRFIFSLMLKLIWISDIKCKLWLFKRVSFIYSCEQESSRHMHTTTPNYTAVRKID